MSQEGVGVGGRGEEARPPRSCLAGCILGPVLLYKTGKETPQNEEGLHALRGFWRWPPGDVVAAGTQGRREGHGGQCPIKEEDLPGWLAWLCGGALT